MPNLPDIPKHASAAIAEEKLLGPAMRALNQRQRAFVDAWFTLGQDADYTSCARAAGYKADSEQSLRVQAHRLAHSERVQAAIAEEAMRRNAMLLPAAHHAIETIVKTTGHDQQFAAAKHIQAQAGFSPVNKSVVVHKTDRTELINEITSSLAILKSIGIKVEDAMKTIDLEPDEW